jgi:1-phosphofructokinase
VIVTLTANPSVDRTVEVDALVRGAVLRATGQRVDPGGKGVNVSRALAAHGVPTRAVLPTGGAEGLQLAQLLEASGVEVRPVPVAGAVRANVSIVEPDGTVTKVNEPGPELDAAEVAALVAATVGAAEGGSWVVLSGSLPPGCPDDFYATLLARLPGPTVLDSSGVPFERALGARPSLVKPNREELAEASGLPVRTVGQAVAAARVLLERGAGAVLASLGADGAVLLDETGAWYGESPVDAPVSSVGAGDATLAGFLVGGGRGRDALRTALAFGAAAVQLPGSRLPGPKDIDFCTVVITDDVPTDRHLTGE